MVFGLFKKKDPVCGMKQEKGKGVLDPDSGNWFCSESCKTEFIKSVRAHESSGNGKKSCCH